MAFMTQAFPSLCSLYTIIYYAHASALPCCTKKQFFCKKSAFCFGHVVESAYLCTRKRGTAPASEIKEAFFERIT